MLLAVTLGAGFGEETVFRGFLFSRLGTMLGDSRLAKLVIVAGSSAWFGLIHYADQGLPGAQQAFIVALVLGTLYARTRELWTPIVAHATFDLTAVALIYWGLESRVAGAVFP
jgi:membrane protease YdiL (CAAX protease family)